MKKLLLLMIMFLGHSIYACTINFNEFNYHTGTDLKLMDIAKIHADCPDQKIKKIQSFISDYNGTVSSRYLTVIAGGSINIHPQRIGFINIQEYLKAEYNNKNLKLKSLKLLSSSKVITSNKRLKITCPKCYKAGEHQMKIHGEKVVWGKVSFIAPTAVLVANKDYQAFSNDLNGDDFSLEKKWVLDPENYYSNKSQLNFYKISKPIQIGQYLKKDSLMAKNIVHIGKSVDVILQNKNITIVTRAIAQGSGHLSDNVLVQNIKTKKKYSATIVGKNKVKVEI